MKDLFGNDNEIIRTLGFYQPFGSLMLPPYYKIETRKVRIGYKPPFPLGKYLFYTTKEPADETTLCNWCGYGILSNINRITENENTLSLNGYAIGIGELKSLRIMKDEDEQQAFVYNEDTKGKDNWCLFFENVMRINPFPFVNELGKSLGKQGVGILPQKYHSQILTPQS